MTAPAEAEAERNPFRPALVIGLVTAGLLSFAAFIVLIGWDAPQREAARRSGIPPDVSAVGFRGIVNLTARLLPTDTVRREGDLDSDDLLVVPLWASDEPERVQRLLLRRRNQPTVLILPKWAVVRDPEQRNWVRTLGPFAGAGSQRLLGQGLVVEAMTGAAARRASADTFGFLEGLALPMPRAAQVIHGDSVELLAGVAGEGALVAQLGSEPHFVVADPDIMNNHALRRPEAALAAVELLARLRPDDSRPIRFATAGVRGVETQPGRNLLRSLFEPPFLAMTLALLAAAVLAALHGLVRFGPALRPVRAIPFGKAALVENSAGLVRHSGREVRLGAAYADLVRDEAARAGAAPSHLQGAALEDYLDRFSKRGETAFRPLAEDVRRARDRNELVAAARALFRWKKDMIR